MKYCKKQNKHLTYMFTISLQVALIFIFLVIFYFSYILFVEKITFDKQINYVVDDLTKNFVNSAPKITDKQAILNNLDQEINKLAKNIDDKNIDLTNEKYRNQSMDFAIAGIVGVIVFMLVLSLFNYCLPVTFTLYESIFSIGFIAMTEFAFLNIVTKNYIAMDPNKVRYNIMSSIYNFTLKQKK